MFSQHTERHAAHESGASVRAFVSSSREEEGSCVAPLLVVPLCVRNEDPSYLTAFPS